MTTCPALAAAKRPVSLAACPVPCVKGPSVQVTASSGWFVARVSLDPLARVTSARMPVRPESVPAVCVTETVPAVPVCEA